jgi:hypothetical protein
MPELHIHTPEGLPAVVTGLPEQQPGGQIEALQLHKQESGHQEVGLFSPFSMAFLGATALLAAGAMRLNRHKHEQPK